MFPLQMTIAIVATLTVASALSATTIALAVDTKQRPAAKVLVERLMQIAVLGASAMAALLGTMSRTG